MIAEEHKTISCGEKLFLFLTILYVSSFYWDSRRRINITLYIIILYIYITYYLLILDNVKHLKFYVKEPTDLINEIENQHDVKKKGLLNYNGSTMTL